MPANTRNSRLSLGYKAHLAVDQGSDLIRRAILTSADIGESIAADALICGDEAAVLADKAYESMMRREALAGIGITDRIMHRRQAGKRQPSWQKWMNVAITPLRGQIEKLFGTLKRRYLYRHVRYRGLERNRCQLWLLCMAMNLRRAIRSPPDRQPEIPDGPTLPRPTVDRAGVLRPRHPAIRHILQLSTGLGLSRQSPQGCHPL
jgi:IS5 family transposase